MRHLLPLLLLLCTGCASYEYQLLEPKQMHIGKKPHTWLDLPPVTYEMAASDSRLVMFIENTTTETLTLRPDKSYVIDQEGASRAVRGLTIAPRSYVKLIFPPPQPYVRDTGPRVGFGFGAYDGGGPVHTGVGVGSTYGGGGPVRGLDENWYWDWDGEGKVRFHFAYTDSRNMYEQDLVINRVKK